MMVGSKLTPSKETSEANLSFATSNGRSPMLFQKRVDIAPDTSAPSVQDVLAIQRLAIEAAQVENDAGTVNTAKTNVGVMTARADGKLASGLPHDAKGCHDLLSTVQHNIRGSWKPASLRPWRS